MWNWIRLVVGGHRSVKQVGLFSEYLCTRPREEEGWICPTVQSLGTISYCLFSTLVVSIHEMLKRYESSQYMVGGSTLAWEDYWDNAGAPRCVQLRSKECLPRELQPMGTGIPGRYLVWSWRSPRRR